MFSRTAKSVAKSLGQCSYHVGEETFKVREFGHSLSQFLKNSSKLESVALNELVPITKSNQNGLREDKQIYNYKDTMPELTQAKFRLSESKSFDNRGNSSEGQKLPTLEAKNEREDLIDILKKLPIAEESETANHLQMMPYTSQDGRDCAKYCASDQVFGQMMPTRFWNIEKKLKKYQGFPKLKKICKSTKSRRCSCEAKHQDIGKRTCAKFPLSINNYPKLNNRHFQYYQNHQSILNKKTIFSIFKYNQSFRFISTNNVNLSSKKGSCKKKIEEYCKKMKEKISGSKDVKSQKKDPCESQVKEENPCIKKTDSSKTRNRSFCTRSNREHPCKKKKNCEKKEDPCKKKVNPVPCGKKKKECPETKKIDPCKKQKNDPCKKESKKKINPCKKESTKKIDPCKKSKIDPCKRELPKLNDPCRKESSKKFDPCKKESTKKIDPCKKPKIDLRKKELPKLNDPCKKPAIDPCKKTSSETRKCPDVDPCKKKKCPPVFRAPGCPPKKDDC